MRNRVLVIGTAAFVVGFGLAFCGGYQAHRMINDERALDQEYGAYEILTVCALLIASIGIGVTTYGMVFAYPENVSSRVAGSAVVIGAAILTFGLGTACWAGLRVQHMETLRLEYEAEYEKLGLWSMIGYALGLLGLAVTIYGLSSDRKSFHGKVLNPNEKGIRNSLRKRPLRKKGDNGGGGWR